MDDLPNYVSVIFVLLTIATFGFLVFAAYFSFDRRRKPLAYFASACLAWLLGTGSLAYHDFFLQFETNPPRLFLFVIPMILLIIVLLAISKTREVLMKMPIATLTYIHIVRIPVEMCLWWLFGAGLVAESMTFEGVNFDIIAGISAPFAGVFLVGRKSNNKLAAIIWNFICLGLVLHIVIRAISLTPYFYNGSGSELQNMAVFYFPFVWLPVFVVPAVIFSHLVSLVQLLKKQSAD